MTENKPQKGDVRYFDKLIVIGGPTASGKTGLALEIARNFNGELVNADSMQVYRYMDIGTNKDGLGEVKGWLFDIVDPDYNFTVAEYQKLAFEKIQNIINCGKLPILVGGTGLYIDAVIKNYEISTNPDFEKRKRLSAMNAAELQNELKKLHFDLDSINNSERNNPRRLIRLIEKADMTEVSETGKFEQVTDKVKKMPGQSGKFDVLFLYPEFEINNLEGKIRARVKLMLENGLIAEVKSLLSKGYSMENKSMQATGYKQVIDFLEGRIKTESELEEKIYFAHRQYAKRQITWFEGKGRGYDLKRVNQETVVNFVRDFIQK